MGLPEMQRMKDAKNELCDGKVDFSYSLTAANFVTWASEEAFTDQHKLTTQYKTTTQYKMLRNIITWRFDDTIRIPKLQGPGWTVTTFNDMTIDKLGDTLFPECM